MAADEAADGAANGTGRTTFTVLGFSHVAGRLVQTEQAVAQSQDHALRQAEALARRLAGTVALSRSAGGDGEVTTILGAFGDVPDDLADGLAGG